MTVRELIEKLQAEDLDAIACYTDVDAELVEVGGVRYAFYFYSGYGQECPRMWSD